MNSRKPLAVMSRKDDQSAIRTIPDDLQKTIRAGQESMQAIEEQIRDLHNQSRGIGQHIATVVVKTLEIDTQNGGSFDIATMTYCKAKKV